MNGVNIMNCRNLIIGAFRRVLPILPSPCSTINSGLTQLNSFSSWSSNFGKSSNLTNLNLTPFNPVIIPSCGFKVKGRLKLRCKDCYLARIDGRMHVLCSTYPRHKQMAMIKRPKYSWILTYCSQSKMRPY